MDTQDVLLAFFLYSFFIKIFDMACIRFIQTLISIYLFDESEKSEQIMEFLSDYANKYSSIEEIVNNEIFNNTEPVSIFVICCAPFALKVNLKVYQFDEGELRFELIEVSSNPQEVINLLFLDPNIYIIYLKSHIQFLMNEDEQLSKHLDLIDYKPSISGIKLFANDSPQNQKGSLILKKSSMMRSDNSNSKSRGSENKNQSTLPKVEEKSQDNMKVHSSLIKKEDHNEFNKEYLLEYDFEENLPKLDINQKEQENINNNESKGEVTLFFKNEKLTIQFDDDTTILDLKEYFNNEKGIALEDFKITYKDKEINDNIFIKALQIKEGEGLKIEIVLPKIKKLDKSVDKLSKEQEILSYNKRIGNQSDSKNQASDFLNSLSKLEENNSEKLNSKQNESKVSKNSYSDEGKYYKILSRMMKK